jgi:hypothetical protein
MTLNMKNYKGFDKLPYCGAHVPKAKATTVSDTPEMRRLAENSKIQVRSFHAILTNYSIKTIDANDTIDLKHAVDANDAIDNNYEYDTTDAVDRLIQTDTINQQELILHVNETNMAG